MKKIILVFSLLLVLSGCTNFSTEKTDGDILTNTDKNVSPSAIQFQERKEEVLYGKESIVEKENVDIDGRHYEYIKYYFLKENTVGILALRTKEDTLIIPNEIFGCSVETLGGEFDDATITSFDYDTFTGQYAWNNSKKQKLKKIIVKNGVKNIYEHALAGKRARKIVLPQS